MQEYTIVVVGGGGVGKTSLTVQLTEGRFQDEYNPTIEDTYVKEMTIDGVKYKLNILDTAGQEEYAILRDQYWRSGDGFLIVFDVTSKPSFDEIESFFRLIQKAQDTSDYPIVLCGNKCDLSHLRQVNEEAAKACALKHNWPYFETSAKLRTNVEESFAKLVKTIVEYKRKQDNDLEEEINPVLKGKSSFSGSTKDLKKEKKRKKFLGLF